MRKFIFRAFVLLVGLLIFVFFVPIRAVPMPPSCWSSAEFEKHHPVLNKKVEKYCEHWYKQDVIPNKRIVMIARDSNERESFSGTVQAGTWSEATVVVGYIRDVDLPKLFPPGVPEHVLTRTNLAEFEAWLDKTLASFN